MSLAFSARILLSPNLRQSQILLTKYSRTGVRKALAIAGIQDGGALARAEGGGGRGGRMPKRSYMQCGPRGAPPLTAWAGWTVRDWASERQLRPLSLR
jgi:hypothetical protein